MKVLLTPPTYYQIEYEINPWMDINTKVNPQKAMEEWEKVVETYKKIGLEVLVLDGQKGLPDMIYAANHGFVIDSIFIKANFRYEQRRKEADFAENFLKEKGYQIGKIPQHIYFEGQGDLFYRDGKFYSGYGKRTAKEAIPFLEKILGQEVITFEVNDPYYYHLDTCFSPLGGGRVVINPASFSKSDYLKIKKNFRKVIETTKEDNKFLCCNLVAQNGAIVLGKGISGTLKHTLQQEGFEIFEVSMTEMLKGGGSVKCLTLEFFER